MSPLSRDTRIACVLFLNFSLHRRYTGDQPVALLHSTKVIAANLAAKRTGVLVGMTLSQAESYCATLRSLTFDRKQDDAHLAEIVSSLSLLTPRLEIDHEEIGVLYVSLQGISVQYKTETAFLDKLTKAVTATGLPFRIGVADTKLLSRIAAFDAKDNTYLLLDAASQTDFLSKQSINRLNTDAYIVDLFSTLGIETVGELSTIPTNEVAARFGKEGTDLALQARGIDHRYLTVRPEAELCTIRMCLDYALMDAESLLLDIQAPLSTTLQELAASGRAVKTLLLKFFTENKTLIVKEVSLAQATYTTTTFFRQLRLSLPTYDFDSEIIEWEIQCHEIQPLTGSQTDLLTSAVSSLSVSDLSIEKRIDNSQNGFLPDELTRMVAHDADTSGKPADCLFSRTTEGLCLFSTPVLIDVQAKDALLLALTRDHTQSPIAKQFGPWVLSGRWWEKNYERWYYEVLTKTNELLLIFFDVTKSRWFLHGVFD